MGTSIQTSGAKQAINVLFHHLRYSLIDPDARSEASIARDDLLGWIDAIAERITAIETALRQKEYGA